MCELPESTSARWVTSSHSSSGVNCVEVALTPDAIGVRDTKDRAAGTLAFKPESWAKFIAALKE